MSRGKRIQKRQEEYQQKMVISAISALIKQYGYQKVIHKLAELDNEDYTTYRDQLTEFIITTCLEEFEIIKDDLCRNRLLGKAKDARMIISKLMSVHLPLQAKEIQAHFNRAGMEITDGKVYYDLADFNRLDLKIPPHKRLIDIYKKINQKVMNHKKIILATVC